MDRLSEADGNSTKERCGEARRVAGFWNVAERRHVLEKVDAARDSEALKLRRMNGKDETENSYDDERNT